MIIWWGSVLKHSSPPRCCRNRGLIMIYIQAFPLTQQTCQKYWLSSPAVPKRHRPSGAWNTETSRSGASFSVIITSERGQGCENPAILTWSSEAQTNPLINDAYMYSCLHGSTYLHPPWGIVPSASYRWNTISKKWVRKWLITCERWLRVYQVGVILSSTVCICAVQHST
jgi:hypothetical protein